MPLSEDRPPAPASLQVPRQSSTPVEVLRPRRGLPCKRDKVGGTLTWEARDSGQARKSSSRKSARGQLGTILPIGTFLLGKGNNFAFPADASAAPAVSRGPRGPERLGRGRRREPGSAAGPWRSRGAVSGPGAPRADLEPQWPRASAAARTRQSRRGGEAPAPWPRPRRRGCPARNAPGSAPNPRGSPRRPGATPRTSAGILRALGGGGGRGGGQAVTLGGEPGSPPRAGPPPPPPFPRGAPLPRPGGKGGHPPAGGGGGGAGEADKAAHTCGSPAAHPAPDRSSPAPFPGGTLRLTSPLP